MSMQMSNSSSSSPSGATTLRSNKRQSLSTIESSVTRLLVSTKHLLESLTQWARQEADDKFVSDAYVKLGNDFRAATRAFTNVGVDISDIGDVPQALRIILEAALSEPPCQENLDRFLPNIRNIIVTLLQNLKAKQVKAKSLSQEKQHRSRQVSPEQLTVPTPNVETNAQNRKPSGTNIAKPSHTAQNDALTQLQKSNVLQRRASKRFSAYQYAKLTNFPSGSGLPKMTPDNSSNNLLIPGHNTTIEEQNKEKPESPNSRCHIFLSIGKKTKKVDVVLPVSFATLRLLFVEKFSYSPGVSSFPEIYIKDEKSGVFYELEDHLLSEVKEGSLVSLNESDSQENLLKDLERKFQELNSKLIETSTQQSQQILSAINGIDIPAPIVQTPAEKEVKKTNKTYNSDSSRELASIQHEIKVLKQVQTKNKESMKSAVSDLVSRVREFQETGLEVSKSSNRAYMESCHTKLSEESDILLTKVDDLQDIMEALRKDVAQRGVRVSEKKLKNTFGEIEEAKAALKSMKTYIFSEKDMWKKIWEAELDKVCEEQQFFNLQDDLTQDLEEDIKKIEETFDLIEQCSLEQTKQGTSKRNRVVAQLHIPEPGESIHILKDAVLNEVAALRPNHESRLEAIAKAEKLRIKERELMKLTKFQEELGEFVDDGKLKKSGGIEELERMRRERDNENLKSSFGII